MKRGSVKRKASKKKSFEAKLRSSSSSITESDDAQPPYQSDDAQPPYQSDDTPPIFLLVHFHGDKDREYSILQLKNKDNGDGDDLKSKVVCFKVPKDCQRANWLFSPPTTSSTEDLFMLPARSYDKQLSAFKFNLRTADFQEITPPLSSKSDGHVVNLNGRIYYMQPPEVFYEEPDSVFECYDPNRKEWSALTPFPDPQNTCHILATAVWGDDTILYNFDLLSGGIIHVTNVDSCHFWAYDVSLDEWYEVDVVDDLCSTILGETVVQGDTIYGLTSVQDNLLLALSIQKKVIDGDTVFKCSLHSKILMPGVKPLYDSYDALCKSRHLVHLGPDYFCIVQCCVPGRFRGYQPIQVIYMKLEGKTMRKTYERIHKWETHPKEPFNVNLCFPLPKGMTTALDEGKTFDFELVPKPEVAKPVKGQSGAKHSYAANAEFADAISKLSAKLESSLETLRNLEFLPSISLKKQVDKEGCSIVVKYLPKNADATQVEKLLKEKFGPIKKGSTELKKNCEGKCYASVEFECETSTHRAIETGTITIGDCPANIFPQYK